MAEIFSAFLLTSAIGTVLALILTLLRPITRRIFSGGWHYYMWLVVLLVMALPVRFNLPEKTVIENPITETVAVIEIQDGNIVSPVIDVPFPQLKISKRSPNRAEELTKTESIKNFFDDKITSLSYIWIFFAIVLFGKKIISYFFFINKIYRKTQLIICPEINTYTSRKIKARVSDSICSPLMVGILKPTLLLPETDISPEQLHNVLAHEITHLKRNDILYKWFVSIVKCVHWFNPAIYFISKQINIDCEISCDLAVVKEMDEQAKKGYVETILSLLTHNNSKAIPLTTGMTGNKKTLKRRFTMIKKINNIKKSTHIFSVILAISFLVTSFLASGVFAMNVLEEKSDIQFICNGKTIEFDNKPFYENNTVYLPLRELLTKIGIMEHKNSSLEWDNGRIIIKLAYDDVIQDYDEQVQERKKSVFGDAIKTLNYCYAIEIGKAEYILNPEDALPFTSERFKTHFNSKEDMKYAPVLKGSTTYVPYEYIDKFLEHNMGGLGPYGIDGPYNITCIVNLEKPVAYVSPCFFWPAENDIDNSISKDFGVKVNPATGEEIFHNGIDTIAKENSNVVTAIRGKVTDIGFDNELGNYVVVENDSGVSTLYAHLSSVDVAVGDELYKRANIGKLGKTGSTTGAFLHFEIKINGIYYDPMKFWAENPLEDIEVIDNEGVIFQSNPQIDNSRIEWNDSAQSNTDRNLCEIFGRYIVCAVRGNM